jgi:nucleotide-binding universal stress UspA family protein
LLIVPEEIDRLKVGRMVVAWKDKREARRAVADALPLLNLAGKVGVVEIACKLDMAAATTHVAAWLGRHGIAAEPVAAPAAEDDADRLAAIAHDYQADLIVAGAYGHSQLREALLGGGDARSSAALRPMRVLVPLAVPFMDMVSMLVTISQRHKPGPGHFLSLARRRR